MSDHVTPPAPAGSLLVIGAGRADGLAGWRAAMVSPEAPVVLVEPDPAAIADLETRLAETPGVTLLPVALGAEAGEAELRFFNVPGLAGLHAPTGLRDLLPGLRELRRVTVRVVPVAEALAGLPDLPDPLHVRIDAPGSEGVILAGLAEAGLLARTARLDLRCGTDSLFENAPDLAAIQARMLAEGLVPAGLDLSDPDWPLASFVPGGFPAPRLMQAKLAEAEARAAALADRETAWKTQVAALEAERTAARTQAETARAEAERKIAALSAEQRRLAAELDSTQAALTAQDAELRQAEARASALKEAVSTREAEVKALEEKAGQRHKRIADLEAEVKKQAAALEAERTAARTQAETARAEAERKIAALSAEQRRLAAELDSAQAALTAQDAELRQAEARASALKEAVSTREAEMKALEEKAGQRHKRIADLEAEVKKQAEQAAKSSQRQADLDHRLTLSRNELRRAEGQIELIKDLLLRGEVL